MIVSFPQLLREICTGAMKSFTAEGNASHDRDLTYADENGEHSFGGTRLRAVRLMAASPKVNAGAVAGDGDTASGLVSETRLTSASPFGGLIYVAATHVPLACQVGKASGGFCAPPWKS